jgi:hypothetical protein
MSVLKKSSLFLDSPCEGGFLHTTCNGEVPLVVSLFPWIFNVLIWVFENSSSSNSCILLWLRSTSVIYLLVRKAPEEIYVIGFCSLDMFHCECTCFCYDWCLLGWEQDCERKCCSVMKWVCSSSMLFFNMSTSTRSMLLLLKSRFCRFRFFLNWLDSRYEILM